MKTTPATPTPLDWSSILALEDTILRASSFTDLLVTRYALTVHNEESSPHESSVLAGIISLQAATFSDLHKAFDEVTDYARHLKNLPRRKS
ncbi:MAG: hypothetical protein ACRCXD_03025 [Luteolibacter sp.]